MNNKNPRAHDGLDLAAVLARVTGGQDLTRSEAYKVFEAMMAGELSEIATAALLAALRTKGETVDELVGAAQAMRSCVVPIACRKGCIDTCGTGGDGISTFNVSTTAAIIAASAGAVVAKHGNRSTTRASGSTEVLTELGIDVEADQPAVERSLVEAGIGYLNARLLHPAMRFAAPVRQAMPVRTIFNLLGPLTNPAGAKRQVLGVPQLALMPKMAEALLALGAEHAWVVHGEPGLCDLSIAGRTSVVEVRDGIISEFTVAPEDVGLHRAPCERLLIKNPTESAGVVRSVLAGDQGPTRDHAVMNAGAALVVAGIAHDLSDGVGRANEALDGGRALATLKKWQLIAGVHRNSGSSGGQ